MYVGSAITGNIFIRFHKHLVGFSGNIIVANAVHAYGLENFAFAVVNIISKPITSENNKELISIEDHYISTLQPVYNIAHRAGNTLGVTHTEETKANIRKNYSSERREAIGALNRGKKLSEKTRKKISQTALKRSPMSIETRALVSAGIAKLYEVTNLDGSNPVRSTKYSKIL